MRKMLLAATVAALSAGSVMAEDFESLGKFYLDARMDYQREWTDGDAVDSNSGFVGKYFILRADGNIAPGLNYSFRQRFNVANKESSFFDSTDWVYVSYDFNEHWGLAGGKQEVYIGGWEYDTAPVDLYSCSVFWNNIPAFQMGAWATYSFSPADKLIFQVSESPFVHADNKNLYGYSVMWMGQHGAFTPLWSANMLEYLPGKFISYISLGSRFDISDKVQFDLDLMNRAADHQQFFFKDMSVVGNLKFNVSPKWNLFVKGSYDVNRAENGADMVVQQGTELTMLGGGLEFFPIRNHKQSLRLHANCFYSLGSNGNPGDVMQDKSLLASVGVKWTMNFLNLKRK